MKKTLFAVAALAIPFAGCKKKEPTLSEQAGSIMKSAEKDADKAMKDGKKAADKAVKDAEKAKAEAEK